MSLENDEYLRKVEEVQNLLYNPEISDTVELSVKNGSKEFKVAKVMDDHIKKHLISLTKKDSTIADFSVIHSEFVRENLAIRHVSEILEWPFKKMSHFSAREVESEMAKTRLDDDFYLKSTGEYGGNIIDSKFIKLFNGIMEEWFPRLIRKYKKQL